MDSHSSSFSFISPIATAINVNTNTQLINPIPTHTTVLTNNDNTALIVMLDNIVSPKTLPYHINFNLELAMKSFYDNIFLFLSSTAFILAGISFAAHSIKTVIREASWGVRDEMVIQNKETNEKLDVLINRLNYLPVALPPDQRSAG